MYNVFQLRVKVPVGGQGNAAAAGRRGRRLVSLDHSAASLSHVLNSTNAASSRVGKLRKLMAHNGGSDSSDINSASRNTGELASLVTKP